MRLATVLVVVLLQASSAFCQTGETNKANIDNSTTGGSPERSGLDQERSVLQQRLERIDRLTILITNLNDNVYSQANADATYVNELVGFRDFITAIKKDELTQGILESINEKYFAIAHDFRSPPIGEMSFSGKDVDGNIRSFSSAQEIILLDPDIASLVETTEVNSVDARLKEIAEKDRADYVKENKD